MKIQNKIIALVICIALPFVILVNLLFSTFFRSFIADQEQLQLDALIESLSSYMDAKQNQYIGSVYDWAQWNDTYDFINGDYPAYAEDNLATDTFENLDISFMIFVSKGGTVFDRYYFDFGTEAVHSVPPTRSRQILMQACAATRS